MLMKSRAHVFSMVCLSRRVRRRSNWINRTAQDLVLNPDEPAAFAGKRRSSCIFDGRELQIFRMISDMLRPAAQKARDEQVSKREEDTEEGHASEPLTRSELTSLFRPELKGKEPD